MMLDHLGEPAAGEAIVAAIEDVLVDESAAKTPDLGGIATTVQLGTAITERLQAPETVE
jgi:tartrate dehydrogenase/decarboxylase/D-malate dehydrogenase